MLPKKDFVSIGQYYKDMFKEKHLEEDEKKEGELEEAGEIISEHDMDDDNGENFF